MPPWLRSRQLRHNRYRLFTVAGGGIVNDKVRLATLLHGSAGLERLGPGSVEDHSPFGERDFAGRWCRLLSPQASTGGKSG
jgi:hypothetical protein